MQEVLHAERAMEPGGETAARAFTAYLISRRPPSMRFAEYISDHALNDALQEIKKIQQQAMLLGETHNFSVTQEALNCALRRADVNQAVVKSRDFKHVCKSYTCDEFAGMCRELQNYLIEMTNEKNVSEFIHIAEFQVEYQGAPQTSGIRDEGLSRVKNIVYMDDNDTELQIREACELLTKDAEDELGKDGLSYFCEQIDYVVRYYPMLVELQEQLEQYRETLRDLIRSMAQDRRSGKVIEVVQHDADIAGLVVLYTLECAPVSSKHRICARRVPQVPFYAEKMSTYRDLRKVRVESNRASYVECKDTHDSVFRALTGERGKPTWEIASDDNCGCAQEISDLDAACAKAELERVWLELNVIWDRYGIVPRRYGEYYEELRGIKIETESG